MHDTTTTHGDRVAAIKALCEQSRAAQQAQPTGEERDAARANAAKLLQAKAQENEGYGIWRVDFTNGAHALVEACSGQFAISYALDEFAGGEGGGLVAHQVRRARDLTAEEADAVTVFKRWYCPAEAPATFGPGSKGGAQ